MKKTFEEAAFNRMVLEEIKRKEKGYSKEEADKRFEKWVIKQMVKRGNNEQKEN